MTVLEAIKGVNSYPVPLREITEIALRRGLTLEQEATQETVTGKAYLLAKADVLLWLSFAPDITQGGQSYSFTDEQRLQLRKRANALYSELGDETLGAVKPVYGYKGSRL